MNWLFMSLLKSNILITVTDCHGMYQQVEQNNVVVVLKFALGNGLFLHGGGPQRWSIFSIGGLACPGSQIL
ncbi:hypothetical protein EMIT043CA1_50361 [Pseudomonas brassicacearum]